jgi:3-oxoacyl-[acyl-carrier-protein] synthase II
MCREIQLGVASASLALENSGLNLEETDHSRMGVDFGANQMFSPPEVLKDACYSCVEGEDHHFNFNRWGKDGLASMEPLWLLKYLPNMPACHIGILADARGPNNSLTQAEASGNLVMGEAFRVITRGSADLMIAGSTGSRLHHVKCLHAALWDDLASGPDGPEKWSRPFDRDRQGQVVGEGACSFIFEDESHARQRGATIYGMVLGAGASCVVRRDQTPDARQALVIAMRAALRDADLSPDAVGHVHAHGLGTKQSDIDEAQAIREVFGEFAEKVPVTALKSAIGNSGSACGTLELAGSLVALRHGVIPATLNYENRDPECPLNVVHGELLPTSNKVVLNVNVTHAGQAAALVVCGE